MRCEVNNIDENPKELFLNKQNIINIIKCCFNHSSKVVINADDNDIYYINYLGNYKQFAIKLVGDIYYIEIDKLQKISSSQKGRLKLKLVKADESYNLECTSIGFDNIFTDSLKNDITNLVMTYLNTGEYNSKDIGDDQNIGKNKQLLKSVKLNIWLIMSSVYIASVAFIFLTQTVSIKTSLFVVLAIVIVIGFVLTKSVTKAWSDKGFISCD